MSWLGILVGLASMLAALRWGEREHRRTGTRRVVRWRPASIAVFVVLLGAGATVLATSLR